MYQHLSGYECYKANLSLMQHFKNQKFNFLDGNRVRFTEQTYINRPDRVFFDKIAARYAAGDVIHFLLVGVLNGCTHITQYAEREYDEWKEIQRQLMYHFERDLNELQRIVEPHGLPLQQVFISANGSLPIALQCVYGKRIKIETICILNTITNGATMQSMKQTTTDTFRFPQIAMKIEKYQGFLNFDKNRAIAILQQHLNQ